MIRALLTRLFGQPARPSVPDALWQDVVDALPFVARLPSADRQRLRELSERFLAEKEFTAVGDLELGDRICLTIAVQACLPILNLGLEWYDDWIGIVVYPDEFVIPRNIQDDDGVVHEYEEEAAGEAWSGGPVIVSWHDVQMAGEGYNVVIHEFVHKLDMRDGEVDGTPPLPSRNRRERWQRVLFAAYDAFCDEVDAAEAAGVETVIDPYAAEHPGEFFAVLAEVFFETPTVVATRFPELHAEFVTFFGIDPLDGAS